MAGDYETLIRATTSVGGHPNGPQVLVSRRQGGTVLRLRAGGEWMETFLNLEQCELLADYLMEPVWTQQMRERQRQNET